MKLCVAQTRPIKGDIEKNIQNHLRLIELAVSNHVETIIFPELSLTGYEPTLAKDLATNQHDNRFEIFQKISNSNAIRIAVGIPTKYEEKIHISLVIFQPNEEVRLYSKKFLHADEEPFFTSGQSLTNFIGNEIALAICYELSVAAHIEKSFSDGAKIYIASVAKSKDGVEKAFKSLSEIAKKYELTVLMSNCLGKNDDFVSSGNSAIWNNKGELLAHLNDADEGILIYDTETKMITEIVI
ncbi:Glutamine-dependent NAD(+) synthetase [Emticicia aquatica]|uniref:Glutamine-dependent NAD(+) synthetase n=1 Tax=Emticicia aquatica TaxID=1681835 RepID=A0ABM9AP11_9BACT|nr:carbon-nitrogen hydrolase family protein [Emticicia aquatica]CAH0995561.1 Glutamine-dependent NAD(+) synthetase [Emticicia aquatica]